MIIRLLVAHRPILPRARNLEQHSRRCAGTDNGPKPRTTRPPPTREAREARDARPAFLSPDALALARKGDIGLPTDAKNFKPQQPEFLLEIKLCKRHTFSPLHMKYLERKGHPLADMFISLYSNKGEQPLWWLALDNMDGSKAIVRRKSMARARYAFRAALFRNGYDQYGRKLVSEPTQDDSKGGGGSAGRSAKFAELYGTVTLRVKEPRGFLKLGLSEVVTYLSTFVQRIEPLLGQKG